MQRQAITRSCLRLAGISASFPGDDRVLLLRQLAIWIRPQQFCHDRRLASALACRTCSSRPPVADYSDEEDTYTATTKKAPPSEIDARNGVASSRKRNPALAAVIREGLLYLNQASSYIQESPHTRKPLVPTAASSPLRGNSSSGGGIDLETPLLTPPQLKQGHRILTIASDCLEEVCRKNHYLTIHGEPIVLLHVHVQPSLQQATIYWTLPLSILWDDDDDNAMQGNDPLHPLMLWMHEQLTTRNSPAQQALALVQRKLYARLSSFKTPKVKWEPAPPEMVDALKPYQHDDSDEEDGRV